MKTNSHIVIKREDIFKYLTGDQIGYLDEILNVIAGGRKKDGKKAINSYYICNIDEPYANEVNKVILKGEYEKRKNGKSKSNLSISRRSTWKWDDLLYILLWK